MKATILVIDDEREFLTRCATAMGIGGFDCELCESAESAIF
jgi:ActR/RegA family two-component response regulator